MSIVNVEKKRKTNPIISKLIFPNINTKLEEINERDLKSQSLFLHCYERNHCETRKKKNKKEEEQEKAVANPLQWVISLGP